MKRCKKCKSKADGSMEAYCGSVYHFCNTCTILLSKIDGKGRIDRFLRPDCSSDKDIPFTQVERSILYAKERRNKGISPWRNVAPDS